MPSASRDRAETAGDSLRHDLTLSRVLEDDSLSDRFAAFLQSEYSHENLAFHRSASAFLEANGATRELRSTACVTAECRRTACEDADNVQATLLINHFVKQGAAQEINLPAGLRASLVEAVRNSDEEELVKQMQAARLEIFKLMERDSFSRFLLTLSSDVPAAAALGGPRGTPGRSPPADMRAQRMLKKSLSYGRRW